MALTVDINITRKLAVINGFVEIPNSTADEKNLVTLDEALSLIPGSTTVTVGSHVEDQTWFVLPAFDTDNGPAQDWFQVLRDAATS